jgi:hypothetical protein
MELQLIIFGAIVVCILVGDVQQHMAAKRAEEAKHATNKVAIAFVIASHPVTIESVKGFLIHIVVYSGYIIPPH